MLARSQVIAIATSVECVECGDGEPYCLEVWVSDISANLVSGQITQLDEADPSCE